jgi:hypothetical protein
MTNRRFAGVAVLPPLAAFIGLLAVGVAPPTSAVAQESTLSPASLPFFLGEEITYLIRSSRAGSVGRGRMAIDEAVRVNGTRTLLLRFDVNTRVGPVRAFNHTRSWLDPQRMAAMRFEKEESHPLSKHTEAVELSSFDRSWRAADGRTGESPTSKPLDELSFIYFIRTLPLDSGATFSFDRHFEMDRNPINVRVVGRELVETGAGEFMTFIVEMRVRDPRRYRGEGLIRINISDDDCRLPVRIESSMPVLGRATLTMESHSHPKSHLVLSP